MIQCAVSRDFDPHDLDISEYPCWFQDAQSGGEIAYCEYGFGPRCPWGLVSSADEERHRSMGMGSGWYTTFLDAFFESFACVELPI
jgi:hypothetical protein